MRRLFILRPEPGSSATLERARAMGLDAEAIPLFRIEPVEWDAPDPSLFDALLLTSANAVRSAGARLEDYRRLPVHAVGEATADAARQARLEVTTVGEGDLRALLRLVPEGQRLLHFCGEHRASAAGVRRRITAVPVYRAQLLPVAGLASALRGQVAAVHSPRSAARLAELVEQDERHSTRVAAISEAAATAAGEGWQGVESASAPNDSELLALAARLCEEGGRE